MSIARLIPVPLAALLAACATALAGGQAPVPAVARAVSQPVFVVTGGGWGHGVGMSQWGAYGQAAAGRTYDRILDTYYRGTTLAHVGKRTVRVLLADGVRGASFTATGPVVAVDATGRKFRVKEGRLRLPATLVAPLGPEATDVTLVPPVRLQPTLGVNLSYAGVARRGAFLVQPAARGLMVVNEVALDAYLRGVVPGEMPYRWPLEALKAQAVAARTYAIAGVLEGRPYDLYADVRSQVYGGIPVETAATDEAVRSTSGWILAFDGRPARTMYFSSSGGRTASALEIFGMEVPYLEAVDDPWDEVSPNHVWPARTFTAAALGRALGLAVPVADVTTLAAAPGATAQLASSPVPGPERLRVLATSGATLDFTRTEIRTRLGLLSTMFRLGVLALSPPLPSPGPGAVVTMTGVARGVDDPVLEKQGPDGSWQLARRLRPKLDGSFSLNVRPVATTVFRLGGSGLAGPTATVPVAAP